MLTRLTYELCFDFTFVVGSLASCMADLLSHRAIDVDISISKALRSCLIHNNSLVTTAKARYSASVDERDFVDCFLDFQVIKNSPR